MKKLIMSVICVLAVALCEAQEVAFNADEVLEQKEVVEVPGMSKEDIFVAVNSMLSDFHPEERSSLTTDLSNLETGTVISKGMLYLGFKKANPMCGYYNYANAIITVRCKDGKYQVVIKVPSYTLEWSADSTAETVPIKHVYPEYDGYKTKIHYTKKNMMEFGPRVGDHMIALMKSIKGKIKPLDDF